MLALMMFVAHLAAQPGETAPEGPVVLRTTTAPKPEKIRKEDLVCRKEALVGTRMKTKICLTQAEWIARGEDDRDKLEKVQSQKPLYY